MGPSSEFVRVMTRKPIGQKNAGKSRGSTPLETTLSQRCSDVYLAGKRGLAGLFGRSSTRQKDRKIEEQSFIPLYDESTAVALMKDGRYFHSILETNQKRPTLPFK